MTARTDWMLIGQIVAPFGLRGEMKVELLTDFPERYRTLKVVYLGDEHRPYEVAGVRGHQGRVLMSLVGIETPEQVERLRGLEVTIPREQAVPLPKGHYYLDDLPGIAVTTTDGRELGVVTEVIRTGGNDVFVVGTGRDSILVPVTKEAVRELDVPGRRAVVEPWILQVEE